MAYTEQRYVLIEIPKTDREETCPFYSVCDGVDDCGVLGSKYNTCKVCNAGMTRAEAVERMAKAIFDYYTDETEPQNWELKEVKDNFNKVAEAALNALLEDKK